MAHRMSLVITVLPAFVLLGACNGSSETHTLTEAEGGTTSQTAGTSGHGRTDGGGPAGTAGSGTLARNGGEAGESAFAGTAGTATEPGLSGAAGTAPSELTERDFVGIIWSLDTYDGQPPGSDLQPSLLIYHEDHFVSDRQCGEETGVYVRDGASVSGSFDYAYGELYDAQECEDGGSASFVPFTLLSGQYTLQVGSGSLTLDGVGQAVYRSNFTAPVEGSGLTGRTWQLVESNHPDFETTRHLDYVMQFESQGIRHLRVAWACGLVPVDGCNEEAGSFGIDGDGGIDLHLHARRYSLPSSLTDAGNADLGLVGDLSAASDYELSGSTLTLFSVSPDPIDYVFEERAPVDEAGGQGGAGGSASPRGSSGAGAND